MTASELILKYESLIRLNQAIIDEQRAIIEIYRGVVDSMGKPETAETDRRRVDDLVFAARNALEEAEKTGETVEAGEKVEDTIRGLAASLRPDLYLPPLPPAAGNAVRDLGLTPVRPDGYTDQVNTDVLARVHAAGAVEVRTWYDGGEETAMNCAEAVTKIVLKEFRPDLFAADPARERLEPVPGGDPDRWEWDVPAEAVPYVGRLATGDLTDYTDAVSECIAAGFSKGMNLPSGTVDPDDFNAVVGGLGREVLYRVLRNFRPDLFADFAPPCGKYGTPQVWLAKLYKDEPFFGLKARDRLALTTLGYYRMQLREAGQKGHADQVGGLIARFVDWQVANPEKVKTPD